MNRKDQILQIYKAGLMAVDPVRIMHDVFTLQGSKLSVRERGNVVHSFDLDRFSSIKVVGCGKAAAAMAEGTEQVLGDRIDKGLVVTRYGHCASRNLGKIQILEGNHPWPDQASVNATAETVKLLGNALDTDLVIALISGGGSALWTLPASGIQLQDIVRLSELLLASGADIHEMNIVRKHISRIKGGQAAQWTHPATVVAILVSDVPGDAFDTIASGPFFPDPSTYKDAIQVIEKYHLTEKIPVNVAKYLQNGLENGIGETPKPGNACFHHVFHFLAASNKLALDSCAHKARSLGYEPFVFDKELTGESVQASRFFCSKIKELSGSDRQHCVIAGGETTVTLGSQYGKGGRNQEFALASAMQIEGSDNITILSCGTDGCDGPTDAAGAVVDGRTAMMLREAGVNLENALIEHDSYSALSAIGVLVKTGPTNTNVMDLQLALIE